MQAAAYHHHLTFLARDGRNSGKNRSGNFTVRTGLKEDGPSFAVVGVTGAVVQEFLHVLSDRMRILASL